MDFYTLASSSGGNAALLRCGDTAVLLDAGISARRIRQALERLGMTPDMLDAVLVTHEHSDHVSGIATLTKQFNIPVYASRGTARRLRCAETALRVFDAGDDFTVGALRVRSFRTSHDAADSVDYRIDGPDGSFGALTDTGFVTPEAAEALAGVGLLLLEANHDVETLCAGPYPYPLKQRVLGRYGHLCNEAAADFALYCAQHGTRDILLAHLSAENNTPAMAEYAVGRRLQAAGLPVRLGVAPRDHESEAHTICKR
ncbi:MAG: MBL fold metallo-hydrolase [Oscillospiraceae bacterium]|nr:MBL fold metallo-hydrolase [Oscillospiraceae bacterium]